MTQADIVAIIFSVTVLTVMATDRYRVKRKRQGKYSRIKNKSK